MFSGPFFDQGLAPSRRSGSVSKSLPPVDFSSSRSLSLRSVPVGMSFSSLSHITNLLMYTVSTPMPIRDRPLDSKDHFFNHAAGTVMAARSLGRIRSTPPFFVTRSARSMPLDRCDRRCRCHGRRLTVSWRHRCGKDHECDQSTQYNAGSIIMA